jgi:alcohol dehydrogenase (cytochrome c)
MLPTSVRIGQPLRPARLGLLTVLLVALLAQAWGPPVAFGQPYPQPANPPPANAQPTNPQPANAQLANPQPVNAQPTTAQKMDWPFYGNDIGGMHYADVDQINPSNVAQLQPAWILHTGVMSATSSFESQPLVVDGTMYVSSPHDHVFALDAASGEIKWTYNPDLPPLQNLGICCGQTNRGIAYGEGKIFLAQLDSTLVALDAATGSPLWKISVDLWENSKTETLAPLYADGKVIVGLSCAEFFCRGHVTAYSAADGSQLWRFYTIPGPGEFGNDTWSGDSWKGGGGSVWGTPTFDRDLGMVYFATGNTAPDANGSQRCGDNLFANSIVALDANTGVRQWHFQEVHHDIWDYDGPEPTLLFTAHVNGQSIPAIGHGNKSGYYYILDRRNGQPVFPVTETPVPTTPAWQCPAPTQPIPAIDDLVPSTVEVPIPGVMAGPLWTVPDEGDPVLIQPGYESGMEWPPAAFSPRTNFVYVSTGGYQPWLTHVTRDVLNSLGGTPEPVIPGNTQYGLTRALDTTTGKIAWTVRDDKSLVRSGVAVAGDLVFFGDSGGLRAADARTGDVLWTFATDPDHNIGGANGSPSVYVVDGREYVVYAFGGNFRLRATAGYSPNGDALIAFALPRSGQPATPPVIMANVRPVESDFPASAYVEELSSPPAGARVVDIEVHDFHYFPSEFDVQPGEQIALHLVDTDFTGYSIMFNLPSGLIGMKNGVAAHKDAYLAFTAPTAPGAYSFFDPRGPVRFFGTFGYMNVMAASESEEGTQ